MTISKTSNGITEEIDEPLVSIFNTFIQTIHHVVSTTTDDATTVATAADGSSSLSDGVDTLEIALRQVCFQVINRVCTNSSSFEIKAKTSAIAHCNIDEIYTFWYQSLQTIYWFMEQIMNTTTTTTSSGTSMELPYSITFASDTMISKLTTMVQSQLSSSSPSSPSSSTTFENPLHRIRQHEQHNTIISHLRKIPLILLEDITDVLSLQDAYQFWSRTLLSPIIAAVGVPLSSQSIHTTIPPKYTAYHLFFSDLLWYTNRHSPTTTGSNPSWLLFLKITNKFIRRLQQSAGRTIVIIQPSSSLSSHSSIIISQLLQLLSTTYSMTEKSSTRVWGSYNEHKVVVTNPTVQQQTMGNTEKAIVCIMTDNTNSNNDLYTIFWKLQDDFRHPNGIVVSEFIQRLQSILRIMESSSNTRRRSTIPMTTNHITNHATDGNVTMKQPTTAMLEMMMTNPLDQLQHDMYLYLLSNPFCLSNDSQLITIQIQQDATIRNIIIVQMYMILHHLLIQVPLLRTQLQTHLHTLGAIVRSSDTNCRTFVDTALHLLNHSELDWRQWKQNKCLPDIEQPRPRQSSNSKSSSTRKRKRFDSKVNTFDVVSSGWTTENDETLTLMDVSTKMRTKYVPTIQDHCQEYVEALDPEAGIDDEYHPKNDTMFNWQALRLFAFHDCTDTNDGDTQENAEDDVDYLSCFQHILPNGDYENMIRHIYDVQYNVLIPGDGPKPYVYDPEDKVEDPEDKVDVPEGKVEGCEDQRMSDVNKNVKETEEDNPDVDMADEESIPSSKVEVDQKLDNERVSSEVNNVTIDDQKSLTDDVQNFVETSTTHVINDSPKNVEQPNNAQPKEVNEQPKSEPIAVTAVEKHETQPVKKIATTSIAVEKNTTRNGDTHTNIPAKAPQSQRQASSATGGSGSGVERNNSTRSNYPIGPAPQYTSKPRESNVERSHDPYSRSRNDVYNSNSARSYHPIDHSGRLTRDAIVKDHVNAAPGGRSRDEISRGGHRDDHHRQPGGGGGGGGDGSRWDGTEWRNDPRGPTGGPDYHHGRGGIGGNINTDRGRDHNRGNTGTGISSNRSRNSGSVWPRDSDGSARR